MDQYLSMIIVAIITGVFSVITLIIQKRQDKVISKIDKQTMFIEKERKIKQQLSQKEKERVETIYNVMMIILETNLLILKLKMVDTNQSIDPTIFDKSNTLKTTFEKVSEELEELNKEYEMIMKLSAELRTEQDKKHNE